MISLLVVAIIFIILIGITLTLVEMHRAPLMATDEMTVLKEGKKQNHDESE